MSIELKEIPELPVHCQTFWKVRALAINDRCPVLDALVGWAQTHPDDHRALMKAMRLAGQQHRVTNPKIVKKSTNKKHGEVYEFIAYTGVARIMFFYDNRDDQIIVCTNEYQKSQGSQEAAFQRCADIRDWFLTQTK